MHQLSTDTFIRAGLLIHSEQAGSSFYSPSVSSQHALNASGRKVHKLTLTLPGKHST